MKMSDRIRRLSGWIAAVLITILVTASLAGCAGSVSGTGGSVSGSTAAQGTVQAAEEETVSRDGTYTSKEEVALYIYLYGELPSNFITKKEAEALGWKKEPGEAGELQNVAPGKSIGGDRFGNYEKLLPESEGRKYFECDINYISGNRGAERIIFSNDGLVFYTGDHYKTFEKLYPKE